MTNSAEAELEAVIWAAMTAHRVSTDQPLEFIEAIKSAAMDYAAGDSDALTETRRLILHEATRPERADPPVVAGGGGQPRRRELGPSGSRARPPGGATLSTGPSIPYPGHGLFNLRPQPVDKP